MSEGPEEHSPDLQLEPLRRDRTFLVRLILLLLSGLMAAAFVGSWLVRRAGTCGASIIQPGATVIPPEEPSSRNDAGSNR